MDRMENKRRTLALLYALIPTAKVKVAADHVKKLKWHLKRQNSL
jgi:hypothetical protein